MRKHLSESRGTSTGYTQVLYWSYCRPGIGSINTEITPLFVIGEPSINTPIMFSLSFGDHPQTVQWGDVWGWGDVGVGGYHQRSWCSLLGVKCQTQSAGYCCMMCWLLFCLLYYQHSRVAENLPLRDAETPILSGLVWLLIPLESRLYSGWYARPSSKYIKITA